MAKKFREKLRKFNPFTRPMTLDELPKPLPANPDQRLVKVYVEGYEDVAFWRGIFDHFQNPYLRFEISVPDRGDLPKGKKVLMGMIPRSSEELLLCVDSDFDYLFAGRTPQSKEVAEAKFMFHTYAYATENYLCYAPSLHNVCVKATKNDTRIFDFVKFMHEYFVHDLPAVPLVCLLGAAGHGERLSADRLQVSRCASATSTSRTTARRRSSGCGATSRSARTCSARRNPRMIEPDEGVRGAAPRAAA